MSTTTPDRIVELWPDLPEEARRKIVELAESIVDETGGFAFTPEEIAGIERGRDDIRQGRSSTLAEYRSEMDDFFSGLKAKAAK